ncbi:MAG: hypothetical protein QF464_00065 [Myxococcota bacterium]|jgi:hypothetical protein|nr:hypothetical protein [Myxococcota bacterium]
MSLSLSNLRREFDWLLKRWLRWSAPVVRKSVGSVAPLLAELSAGERARYDALAEAYDISGFGDVCTRTLFYQCMNRLDLLDQHVAPTPPGGLDVGALNWTYLPALAAFKPGCWDGYELDGYQRYISMDTRGAQGRHMAAAVAGATYHVGSILDVRGQWGLVTWFLPYVTPGPLVSAGLPDRFYDPATMLTHVWSLVAPGGALFVMNVDADEDHFQARLFADAGIPATRLGLISSVFDDEEDENHGWVAVKPTDGSS